MRRVAAVLVAAVSLPAAALAAPPQARPSQATQAHGVVARVRLSPQSVLFGDVVTATVDVVVDRRRVDPGTISVHTTFNPYQELAAARTMRRDAGDLTELRTTYRIDCFVQNCFQPGTRLRVTFPPALVFFTPRRGGPLQRVNIRWPLLVIDSRLDSQAVAQSKLPGFSAPWRANVATMPPAGYRVGPTALEWSLFAAGFLFVGGGLALVVVGVGRGSQLSKLVRRRARPLPRLEHALAQVERARAAGQSAEQRRALELLAAELRLRGADELAGDARELAWAPPGPDEGTTVELTGRVRDLIAARTNGRRNGA